MRHWWDAKSKMIHGRSGCGEYSIFPQLKTDTLCVLVLLLFRSATWWSIGGFQDPIEVLLGNRKRVNFERGLPTKTRKGTWFPPTISVAMTSGQVYECNDLTSAIKSPINSLRVFIISNSSESSWSEQYRARWGPYTFLQIIDAPSYTQRFRGAFLSYSDFLFPTIDAFHTRNDIYTCS